MEINNHRNTFFIEFIVDNMQQFKQLQKVFYALKDAKKTGTLNPDDEQHWKTFFNQKALDHFWWPTEQEIRELREAKDQEMKKYYDPKIEEKELRETWKKRQFLRFIKKFFSILSKMRKSGLPLQRTSRPGNKWHFSSMLSMIKESDYNLVSCELISPSENTSGGKNARLMFDPLGNPYGGTGSLRCLIEAFGFSIIKDTG